MGYRSKWPNFSYINVEFQVPELFVTAGTFLLQAKILEANNTT